MFRRAPRPEWTKLTLPNAPALAFRCDGFYDPVRDRIVVVVAGYTDEMDQLLSSNPGLRSRFPTVIVFPDYSDDELVAIVDSIGERQRYELTDDARTKLRSVLAATPRGHGFGNARLARNLFEAAINNHARRIMADSDAPTEADLTSLADQPPTIQTTFECCLRDKASFIELL